MQLPRGGSSVYLKCGSGRAFAKTSDTSILTRTGACHGPFVG